ncbi:hypothetical protein D3C86_1910670 [compost metagenome]
MFRQVALGGVQTIGDDLLQRPLDVVVKKTIPQPYLQGSVPIVGNQLMQAGIQLVQIFDDDTRFRHVALAVVVADHREFPNRPEGFELRAVGCAGQVDDAFFEFDTVFVERDQDFVAER